MPRSTHSASRSRCSGSPLPGTRARWISSSSSIRPSTRSPRPRSLTTICCATFAGPASPIILSTGMSTYAEIDHAVEVLGKEDLILMHATSTYPANYNELESPRDPDHGAALRCPDRLLRPRNRNSDQCLRRRAGRLLRGAPHHHGPRYVGLGPGGLAGTKWHHRAWCAIFVCGSNPRAMASSVSTSAKFPSSRSFAASAQRSSLDDRRNPHASRDAAHSRASPSTWMACSRMAASGGARTARSGSASASPTSWASRWPGALAFDIGAHLRRRQPARRSLR